MVIAGVDPPIVLLKPLKVKFPLLEFNIVPFTNKLPLIPIFLVLLLKIAPVLIVRLATITPEANFTVLVLTPSPIITLGSIPDVVILFMEIVPVNLIDPGPFTPSVRVALLL